MARLNQLVWPASMSAFGDKADIAARVPRSASHLVQPEFAADRLQFRRLDQLAVCDTHRMEWPLELFLPESKETLQLGKFGEQIVVLPEVGLQHTEIR